jgi:hypothetical protein
MVMAQFCAGDSLVTLVKVIPLRPADGVRCQFIHRDLPTGETTVMEFASENDAAMTFAAWIASDCEDLGALEDYRQAIPKRIRV